ncbi:hypothetical protein [Pseudarthrobacter chlorophenolicus]|uniref:hypothetical protein n=1 Tax=Pseudarthrobacter chlorophenolicus TaxID=85085 RepID=UPI00126A5D47|nr:hypothetical protein [Pseudarthrobacter chlorophenolicus]
MTKEVTDVNRLVDERFRFKKAAVRAAFGFGVAALIAVSSYSAGARNAGPSAEGSQAGVVTTALVGSSAGVGKGASASQVSDSKGVPISVVIKQAKKKDAAGFATRLETLKSSPEFSGFLIAQAGSVEAGGGEGLAAALTQEQVDSFVASIRGKSFELVTGTDGQQSVALTSKKQPKQSPDVQRTSTANAEPTITTAGWSGPSCWQGWFAAGGYAAATGAICGAVGAMSAGIGGAACGAGAWAFGTGINWNDACR